jgi:hypothetical protein
MLRYLVALLLLLHGAGHVMGFLASWTTLPMGFTDQPWILPGDAAVQGAVGRAFGLLWLVAMIATMGAAIALLLHQPLWRPLSISASVISLVAIVPWWNTVPAGPRFGAVSFDVVVIAALSFPWRDAIVRAVE